MRVVFLIILLSSSHIFAQNMLKGNVSCSKKMINVNQYNFNDKKHVSTIKIDSLGLYLKDLSKFEVGEYNLKNEDIDIDFIYNNESIVFEDNCNNQIAVKFTESEENITLNNFFEFYYTNNTSFGLLNQLLNFYPKTDEFYCKIEKRTNELNELNNHYIDSLKKYRPNLLATEVIKLYKYSPTGFIDMNQTYSLMLTKTKFLGDLIISYLNTYEKEKVTREQQQQAFLPAIDTILLSFKKNELLTLYVADFLIEKFRYYDLDMVYEYTALKTQQLLNFKKFDLKDKNIAQKVFNINNIVSAMVGKKAYNFKIDEKTMLYDIKSTQKLVVFWASWCPHCEETINELAENIKDIAPNLKIITYSLDYENKDWQNKADYFPKEWIKICNCNNKENVPDKYSVYATPTLFLLDEDNTILAKPNSYLNLLDFIGDE